MFARCRSSSGTRGEVGLTILRARVAIGSRSSWKITRNLRDGDAESASRADSFGVPVKMYAQSNFPRSSHEANARKSMARTTHRGFGVLFLMFRPPARRVGLRPHSAGIDSMTKEFPARLGSRAGNTLCVTSVDSTRCVHHVDMQVGASKSRWRKVDRIELRQSTGLSGKDWSHFEPGRLTGTFLRVPKYKSTHTPFTIPIHEK